MKKQLAQVAAFHALADSHAPRTPTNDIRDEIRKVRIALLAEEVKELIAAIKSEPLDHIAKELADLLYVTLGTVHAFGLGDKFEAIFDAVHESNLKKIAGKKRLDKYGKIVKPEGYTSPDIAKIISSGKSK